MVRFIFIAVAIFAYPAMASEPSKVDDARLAAEKIADGCDALFGDEIAGCYKAVSEVLLKRAATKGLAGASPSAPATEARTAAFPSSSLPSSSFVKLTGADLAVQTHKWDGKVVQTLARCFYADKNEYRCVVRGGPRVDFATLKPDSARDRIEAQCDTIQKVETKACTVTLQFVYAGFDEQDTGGLGRLKIVVARDNAGFIVEK